jgi:hypothetical protein
MIFCKSCPEQDFFLRITKATFAVMLPVKRWFKANFPRQVYRKALSAGARAGMDQWLSRFSEQPPAQISDASRNVFTYHGEDGILLYLLSRMESVPRFFADIGAGDGITGNCTNLAVHHDWTGVFIDENPRQVAVGRRFYEAIKPRKQPLFLTASVSPGNVNGLLKETGVPGEIGLLSIDIDGNDYWIWEAIRSVRARIVVIEAKVEFGPRDIVVPYGEQNHRRADNCFNGASIEALRKLGHAKGYKLAGANKQAYNLFFVQAAEPVPEITTAALLEDPGVKKSFYPDSFFTKHTFAG